MEFVKVHGRRAGILRLVLLFAPDRGQRRLVVCVPGGVVAHAEISLTEFPTQQARQEVIDELLRVHRAGDPTALARLWAEVYTEVKRLARSVLAGQGASRPVDTTVLVHELYLKMGGASFDNRAHLFGSLVRMMGQIIIDAGRRRQRLRHHEREAAVLASVTLDPSKIGLADDSLGDGVVTAKIIDAMDRLDRIAPRPAAVAWLRFVGTLSVPQVAECLEVSERTVKGDWAFARAWLHRELTVLGLKPRATGNHSGGNNEDSDA